MKRWYVIQVYAGYEDAVKADILKRVEEKDMHELFGQVLIPSAKVKQMFETGESEDQQLFPGYMIVEMEMLPESLRLVKSSPRVMRFLGGTDPVPLSKREVDRIVSQMTGEISLAKASEDFIVGREVEISDGPFAGFVGMIEKVDAEGEKLTIMVSIFGRMTPVELGFHQVKR
jgi:transcriptional antiterminator NusG